METESSFPSFLLIAIWTKLCTDVWLRLERERLALTARKMIPDVTFHNMLSQVKINISEHRLAAIYSEHEAQLFLKQFKFLTKLKYVITQK
jgi:hypothetical protein